MAVKRVEFYICPTPECNHYSGSSGMHAFMSKPNRGMGPNGETIGEPYNRTICPTCRDAGRGDVERKLIAVEVDVPAPVAAA